jgi:hypothetical protein
MFRNGGVSYLHQIKAEAMSESLYLDFKQLDGGSAPMPREARNTLAKVLSGFANSDGGVTVWGVECSKRGKFEPDTVKKLRPIRRLKILLSELNSYSAQLVSPGIVGVEHTIIEDADNSDVGFAVSYVPRSDQGLHMAVGQDQHCYYYRTTDSFLKMEAYMVADRFGRRLQPKLELVYRLKATQTYNGSRGSSRLVEIFFGIRNIGPGLALRPALAIRSSEIIPFNNYGIDGNYHFGLTEKPRMSLHPDDYFRFFSGGSDDVVFPATTLSVIKADIEVWDVDPQGHDVTWPFELYCEGFATKGELTITADEIVRACAQPNNPSI